MRALLADGVGDRPARPFGRGLRPPADPQLAQDVADVHASRLGVDEQFGADLGARAAGRSSASATGRNGSLSVSGRQAPQAEIVPRRPSVTNPVLPIPASPATSISLDPPPSAACRPDTSRSRPANTIEPIKLSCPAAPAVPSPEDQRTCGGNQQAPGQRAQRLRVRAAKCRAVPRYSESPCSFPPPHAVGRALIRRPRPRTRNEAQGTRRPRRPGCPRQPVPRHARRVPHTGRTRHIPGRAACQPLLGVPHPRACPARQDPLA